MAGRPAGGVVVRVFDRRHQLAPLTHHPVRAIEPLHTSHPPHRTWREPFREGSTAARPMSYDSPHVRCSPTGRTSCGEPNNVKKENPLPRRLISPLCSLSSTLDTTARSSSRTARRHRQQGVATARRSCSGTTATQSCSSMVHSPQSQWGPAPGRSSARWTSPPIDQTFAPVLHHWSAAVHAESSGRRGCRSFS